MAASEGTGTKGFAGPAGARAGAVMLFSLAVLVFGICYWPLFGQYWDQHPSGHLGLLAVGILLVAPLIVLIPAAVREIALERRVRDRVDHLEELSQNARANEYEGRVLRRLVELSPQRSRSLSLREIRDTNDDSDNRVIDALFVLEAVKLVKMNRYLRVFGWRAQVTPKGNGTVQQWKQMDEDRRRQNRESVTITINGPVTGSNFLSDNNQTIVFQGVDQNLAICLDELAKLIDVSNMEVPKKEEVRDNLSALAEQSGKPPKERNRATINNAINAIGAVLTSSGAVLNDANRVMETWQKTEGLLKQLFGAVTGSG